MTPNTDLLYATTVTEFKTIFGNSKVITVTSVSLGARC